MLDAKTVLYVHYALYLGLSILTNFLLPILAVIVSEERKEDILALTTFCLSR
jgi:hypothetical protein